jgi:hypothetical protein
MACRDFTYGYQSVRPARMPETAPGNPAPGNPYSANRFIRNHPGECGYSRGEGEAENL